MSWSWKLGRVAGIDLFLHPSALLVFFLVSGVSESVPVRVAFVVALFGSILLHELGHAMMARKYGIGTADITLYLFGGVARLERMPRSAGPELLIALAGPAVNVAIILALAVAVGMATALDVPATFLAQIVSINVYLAAFNLLPVFPMDGGRVFRALLSGWLGRVRATEIAATVGRFLAAFGVALGLVFGQWPLAILALFIYIAGTMELRQVWAEGRPRGVPEGLADVPQPPAGFRWADRGDGILRLVPILITADRQARTWN